MSACVLSTTVFARAACVPGKSILCRAVSAKSHSLRLASSQCCRVPGRACWQRTLCARTALSRACQTLRSFLEVVTFTQAALRYHRSRPALSAPAPGFSARTARPAQGKRQAEGQPLSPPLRPRRHRPSSQQSAPQPQARPDRFSRKALELSQLPWRCCPQPCDRRVRSALRPATAAGRARVTASCLAFLPCAATAAAPRPCPCPRRPWRRPPGQCRACPASPPRTGGATVVLGTRT